MPHRQLRKHESTVLVILAYYNGKKYILEQLNSIFSQSYNNIDIHISDDKSDLDPDSILSNIPEAWKSRISFSQNSENLGYCQNFLTALSNASNDYDYYAFSDQDDIWYPDKISRALEILSQQPSKSPSLYCARTEIFDITCQNSLGYSSLFKKQPSFANALVQCIAGGNTMVCNGTARNVIVESATNLQVVSHDWWCYQIISGIGGLVYYDSVPALKYRQHNKNIMGSNLGWIAKLTRIKGLFNGRFKYWNDTNTKALSQNKELLTPANQRLLEDFVLMRNASLLSRFFLFFRIKCYRQTLLGNIGLYVGLIFKKV